MRPQARKAWAAMQTKAPAMTTKSLKLWLSGDSKVSGERRTCTLPRSPQKSRRARMRSSAAIKAGIRRAVLEATLLAPHDVAQFMTDAVHLMRPVPELGDWRARRWAQLQ